MNTVNGEAGEPGAGQRAAGAAVPGPLRPSPALQAVLRELLPPGGPAPRRQDEIAAAAGLSRQGASAVLSRLAAAGWTRAWEAADPGGATTRAVKFHLLLPAAVPLASQALADPPRDKLSVLALRALAAAGRPMTTAEVTAAAGAQERGHSCKTALDNHRAAGRAVSRGRTPAGLEWSVTPAGLEWLGRGGDPGGPQGPAAARAGLRALRVLAAAQAPLTAAQVSAALGGNPGASPCAARLARLARQGLAARSGSRPPYTWQATPAGRQLAAEDGPEPGHGYRGYYRDGCRCPRCNAAAAQSRKLEKHRNSRSRDTASHHGEQWTGPQLETVSRTDLTIDQAAAITGRTRSAVWQARTRLRDPADPLRGLRDGQPPTSTGTGRRPRPPFTAGTPAPGTTRKPGSGPAGRGDAPEA